jgi:predicted ester cyclase
MLCKNVYIIGLQVDGKRVSFEYFEKLYKIQNDKYDAVSRGGLRVTRKLTHAHV